MGQASGGGVQAASGVARARRVTRAVRRRKARR